MYSSDANATEHFYAYRVGAVKGADCQDANGSGYYVSPTQFVEVVPSAASHQSAAVSSISALGE
jgi:hypothetical protein